ncbi:hypothetical protein Fcan01_16841 [Folsomia candida]|uniref:Gustatory receptor n=1 Tax=Folsomia candida TaxID=158441 RepID=A0A226DUB7_FOLCA|nr:hypothetical protein Fcan01_16841 [Folsomia candida]
MWHIEGTRHFRTCIKTLQRNSLRSVFFLEWNSKLGKAVPMKSSNWQYRGFKLFALFSTIITQPILLVWCYQANKSVTGSVTLVSKYASVMSAFIAFTVLPYLRFFAKESNSRKFVTYFHEILNLDKRLTVYILLKLMVTKSKYRPRKLDTVTKIANLGTFTMNYIAPAFIIWASVTNNSPFNGFILHLLNVTRINFFIRVITATLFCITFNIFISITYLCILFTASGILVLHFWSNYLLIKNLSFYTTIKVYNQLKIMTIFMQEVGHDLVTVCLHHAYMVLFGTIVAYHFILQFTHGKDISVGVTLTALIMFSFTTGTEILIICIVSKASKKSKETLRKLLLNHGKNRYRRRVILSMLPNSISLEFIDSVDTIRNGIGMDYFLRYVERVQSYTSTLLLATKHKI